MKNGDMDFNFTDIPFANVKEFESIEKISFSLKELIELCEKDNFNIRICAKDDYEHITTVEIEPYMPFELNDDLKTYLETVK